MRERTMILWIILLLLLELPSDIFGGATRSFTSPMNVRQDTQLNVTECRRRTPMTWECADFIIAKDLH